ncbi:MAG: hypothetical protein ACYSUF_09185, partial [Planctomycetota bacterium]
MQQRRHPDAVANTASRVGPTLSRQRIGLGLDQIPAFPGRGIQALFKAAAAEDHALGRRLARPLGVVQAKGHRVHAHRLRQ